MDLDFGLRAGAGDFAGERHRRRFFCGAASLFGGSSLVFAPRTLGLFADAIDLALQLMVSVLAHAREFRRETDFSVGLDASHFLGGAAGGGLFGSGSGLLQVALAHGRGFCLNAGHVLGLRLFGRFLRALELFGERFIRACAHARQFVGELLLGLVAYLLEFGAQRLFRVGLGRGTRLRDRCFAQGRRFGFDSRHFGRALFRGFGTHALEFGGHLRGRFTLPRSLGFDTRHVGGALLSGLGAHALDLRRHLCSRFALRSRVGLDAHALHLRRHLCSRFALRSRVGLDAQALHLRRHLCSRIALRSRVASTRAISVARCSAASARTRSTSAAIFAAACA